MKYTSLPSNSGEKVVPGSYGLLISSSDNPVDFHE